MRVLLTLNQAALSKDECPLSMCCFYSVIKLRRFCQSSETMSLSHHNKWVWLESFIRTAFYKSHHTTDPVSLSLSAFYTLHHNIMWCNPATKVSHRNVFTSSMYMKKVSCMMSSQWWVSRLLKHHKAGILVVHWYSTKLFKKLAINYTLIYT